MVSSKWLPVWTKIYLDFYLTPHTKVVSRCERYTYKANRKKSQKLSSNLCNRKQLLKTSKAQIIEQNTHEFDYVKIERRVKWIIKTFIRMGEVIYDTHNVEGTNTYNMQETPVN